MDIKSNAKQNLIISQYPKVLLFNIYFCLFISWSLTDNGFCATICARWFTSSSHLTEALNCCSVWNCWSVMESTVDRSKPVWLHMSSKSFLESRREWVVIYNKDKTQPIQWQTLTNIKQIWIFLVLQEPILICLFALFMSVGYITNCMRRMHVEVHYHKHVPCSSSEPPIANLKHSLDSHTPFTTKLKLSLNWGFLNLPISTSNLAH